MGSKARNVFLIGAKNFGAYGGFETFVNKLTEYHQDNKEIKYHVACKANGNGCMDETKLEDVKKISDSEFAYHHAHCFKIHVPNIGPAEAVFYDLSALDYCCKYIAQNHVEEPIVYILACRIGPFFHHYRKKIHELGGKLYLNPDGHEWARSKWNAIIRQYWKISEAMMVKNSDLVVCDSKAIEKYIHERYDKKGYKGEDPKTVFIPYGAETRKSTLKDQAPELIEWYQKNGLKVKQYYLIVGRFVPENNYETIIREFMKSGTKRDLAIVTTENKKFSDELEKKLHFEKDPRIKFVGTVYDQELLMKIRENAFAYIHGHEVGGTNPSLLESLSATDVNLLLDVEFNREVAGKTALYWDKKENSLSQLLDMTEKLQEGEIRDWGIAAKMRIRSRYSWEMIADHYAALFLKGVGE